MKTEIIKTEQTVNEIDWSKPQLVKSKITYSLVLTTGMHSTTTFSGIRFGNTENDADYCKELSKENFTPITEPVTIKFIP